MLSITEPPPSVDERSRRVLKDVVDECDAALSSENARAVLDSVRTAMTFAGVPDDAPLLDQLRAIEFEADRITFYGTARTRSRLAYARALIGLPMIHWR